MASVHRRRLGRWRSRPGTQYATVGAIRQYQGMGIESTRRLGGPAWVRSCPLGTSNS